MLNSIMYQLHGSVNTNLHLHKQIYFILYQKAIIYSHYMPLLKIKRAKSVTLSLSLITDQIINIIH